MKPLKEISILIRPLECVFDYSCRKKECICTCNMRPPKEMSILISPLKCVFAVTTSDPNLDYWIHLLGSYKSVLVSLSGQVWIGHKL